MRALLVLVALWAGALGSLTQTRSQNRELQRAVSHKHLTLILEGVRERTLTTVQPDPILLIDFPEINYQFKVSQIPFCILTHGTIHEVTFPDSFVRRHFRVEN